MDVFRLQEHLVKDYGNYTRSFIKIKDSRINEFVEDKLRQGAYWPEPLVQLNPTFEPGGFVRDLVARGLLHPGCEEVFRVGKEEALPGSPIQFHRHQLDAIELYNQGKSYILTSGTGSGKSLTYIVPIVDHVLRNGTGKGIQAIVVYPMNALANSQFDELQKFLEYGFGAETSPVSFARYTGQEDEAARTAIQTHPPDILLTNYMMLELLLTRKQDQSIVRHAQGLKFLVFDEIHTYRGRQGADVAMLIRRTKQTLNAQEAICIGTSATMASGKNLQDQKVLVADVARKMFATTFDVSQVVGETLARRTHDFNWELAASWKALASGLQEKDVPDDPEAFRMHPVASWIESFFGLMLERNGDVEVLKRRIPRTLRGKRGAVEELMSGLEKFVGGKWEEDDLEATLVAFFKMGAQLRLEGERYPMFAFKLHQFFSRGDTVWSTLELPEMRHLEISKKVAAPGDAKRLLFPLVFCKSCGCEYYRVQRLKRPDGSHRIIPREDRFDLELDEQTESGYLYVAQDAPWPSKLNEASRLPELFLNADGTANRDQAKWFPESFRIAPDGEQDSSGMEVAYIQSNLRFCLHPECGVTYDARTLSERAKLLTLGVDTRSTATTILALRTLQELRHRSSDLPEKAKKLLSFTDNRQDASLQAGHFNDFAQVALVRSALYRVLENQLAGSSIEALPKKVFDAMGLEFEDFASNPSTRGAAREPAIGALVRVIEYYILRDMQEGWRVTTPNLEQCGLLNYDYAYLTGGDGLVGDQEVWTTGFRDGQDFLNLPEALQDLDVGVRERLVRVLLDYMRRSLCVKAPGLDSTSQHDLTRAVFSYLAEDTVWYIEDKKDLVRGKVFYPSVPRRQSGDYDGISGSALSVYGKFLKRELQKANSGLELRTPDVTSVINYLVRACTTYGLIEQVIDFEGVTGYQLVLGSILWKQGNGVPPENYLRHIQQSESERAGNVYFKHFYEHYLEFTGALEAREHTAQVDAKERERRENAFKSAELPLLFCSPTMELGVDISQLNVVNLRNVPPTPANYAQRSGRAGRGGQPAFVFTYCAGRSPHDQYYFTHPEAMVAGEVAAPRIDLTNEDLLKSHVHAIWLECAGLDLGTVVLDVIDLTESDEHGYTFKPHVLDALNDEQARRLASTRAIKVLESVLAFYDEGQEIQPEGLVEKELNTLQRQLRRALERWYALYSAALSMKELHNKRVSDAQLSENERNISKSLRAQAESQLDLLTRARGAFEGDFYSYRYFAAEGFLPGYNFPRLPISAFIPGRRRNSGRDEFVSRARFLAISEFGPRSLVYHNGRRYQVNNVSMNLTHGEEGLVYQELKRCETCGHGHLVNPETPKEICTLCEAPLLPEGRIGRLVQMQNVTLKLKERITCDEEERQRFGYRITSAVSFEGQSKRFDAVLEVGGAAICSMYFGPTATLWRINRGWSNSNPGEPDGFVLDLESGRWQRNNAEEEDNDAAHGARTARIVPYVQDQKNALLLIPKNVRIEAMPSLQSVLKEAIQQVFQIEPMELGMEALPSRRERRSLLMYEVSEGGAGVLKELIRSKEAWPKLIAKALEICHFDPDTGADLGDSYCSKACYSCLLDYANQPDHHELDRYRVKDVLWDWRKATLRESGGEGLRSERFEALLNACDSQLERDWLQLVFDGGYHLPSHSQQTTPGVYARPDFEYRDQMAAIFIDGPPHDQVRNVARDVEVTESLEAVGYRVIRFRYDEKSNWKAIMLRYEDIFGKSHSA
jgi:hypothetical protein